MARVAEAGAPTVPSPGPLLPADATTIVPFSAALLAANALAEVALPAVSPNDRLITSATGLGTGVGVVVPELTRV